MSHGRAARTISAVSVCSTNLSTIHDKYLPKMYIKKSVFYRSTQKLFVEAIKEKYRSDLTNKYKALLQNINFIFKFFGVTGPMIREIYVFLRKTWYIQYSLNRGNILVNIFEANHLRTPRVP